MELTKEQVQKVENYLNTKGIDYIDIRLEVFDHIVSDIESKIENEKLNFETAFKYVTIKWNKHLVDTSSWVFGVGYSAPKIVIEKAKKQFKKWFKLSFFIFLFSLIFIDKLSYSIADNLKNNINHFLQIITVLSFLIFVFLLILKSKNKIKTTYSFILKTQNLNVLFGIILLLDFDFLNKEGNFDNFIVTILIAFVLSIFSYFHFEVFQSTCY